MITTAALILMFFQSGLIRVYVFTHQTEGGFVDADSQRRNDSVLDLQKALAKRKGFAVAESAKDAELLLEVTTSGNVETAPIEKTRRRTGILGPYLETTTEKNSTPMLISVLRIPGSDYTLTFTDQDRGWSYMAVRTINALENWVKQNRARLLAR